MPKFKLHAVECITQEEGRRVNVKTRVRQGIVSAHRGRLCAAFPGSSGGTLSTENITQHNTTQHNTHTHGEEMKGKETLIRYYASSASWTATTTRVQQASGVDTVVTEVKLVLNTFI